MTELTNTNNAPTERRSIETITAEINTIRGHVRRVVLEAGIEIGRRLVEAKEMLPYGEWGAWLKERVDFSQDSAERLMKVYREYADKQTSLFGAEIESATLRNLSISNALLLANNIPAEEREAFAVEHDVENLSTRELAKLIKEREEAMQRADEEADARKSIELRLKSADKENERKTSEIMKLLDQSANEAEKIRDLEAQIRELERRPVEVAVQEPDPEELQKRIDAAVAEAVKEAKATAAEDRKKLKDKLAAAEKQRNDLEVSLENAKKQAADAGEALEKAKAAGASPEEVERLEREIGELKKKLAMSDAAVTTFNTLFAQAQDILNRLLGAMAKVEDGETGDKLRAAFRKLLEVYGEKVGG